MRQVKEYDTDDGPRFRVRFRQGGTQTSETFRRKADATAFAAVLDGGGVVDALQWLAARDRQASAVTFGEFFETYVDQLTGVTSRTRDDYRALRRRYLADLDTMPLPLVARAHIAAIVNRLEAEGKSPKTIKNVIHMLSSCLTLAIEEGHTTRNPCRRVRMPAAKVDSGETRFLNHDEFGALYDATPEHYRALVVFLAGTGLRWSEATALQSRHVDLSAGTVRVEQAWKRVAGGWDIGPPKSAKSRRTVNPGTLALLAVEPLLGAPRAFVFTTPTGQPVRHSNFYNRIWRPSCAAAGLDPQPRIHDLRHTHASWLISDGQSLEATQDQLGHESILTTRSVYSHLLPALGVAVGKSASAALERALSHSPRPRLGLDARVAQVGGRGDES